MNDRLDIELVVADWLRAAAPPRAPQEVLSAALEQVARVGQGRPLGGRRFDEWISASPRLHWAVVGALLAAALLGTIAGAGALLRHESPPRLNLARPVDLQAFVLSTYDQMPDMPPVAITTLTDGSVKGRIYVARSGAVRIERYASAEATEPDTYEIYSGNTIAQLATVGSTKEWVQQDGAISEDPRVFLLAAMEGGAAYNLPGCEVTRNGNEVGNGTAASAWSYVGLEYVAGRPAHHVACGGGDLWIDVETRLILRSRGPIPNASFQPVPGSSRTIEVTALEIGDQPADLFKIAQPAGVTSVSSDTYECQLNPPACATPEPAPPVYTPPPRAVQGPIPPLGPSHVSNGWIAFSTQPGFPEALHECCGSGGDIYLVREGIEPRLIVSRGSANTSNVCPAFSPDGLTLVYGHRDGSSRALILLAVSPDGSVSEKARLDVPGDSNVPCPRWSTDGTRLAYLDGLSRDGVPVAQPASLVVRGLDGSTLDPGPSDPTLEELQRSLPTPALASPSGEWVALADDRGVLIEHPDGSDARVLLTPAAFGSLVSYPDSLTPYTFPAWSPDGRFVLAMADVGGPGFAVAAVSVDSPAQSIVLAPFVALNSASNWPGRGDASWQPVFGASAP